ncbi:MAG TPA: WYL domain-containing protein [Streptosporangiaceae bacterium]|jgi:proteasome accessory factor B|nr:WYL domain-containing protein [Streptosporangiaceae bacterium]
MSKQKTERLLSLVVCLLSSRRYLTAGQIREAVPGYPQSFEAFKRMFERDKDELRELGIPLETGTNAPDEEAGYRIPPQAYELPEIMLEPDEAAVLGLAAKVWQRAELAGAAAGGLLKLRAAGIEADETARPGIEPRLATEDAAFGPLWRAVRDRRPVAFGYRAAGRPAAQERHLEPWGVVNRHARWYVVGFDRDRGEERVFRLSRIEGEVTFTGPTGTVVVPAGTDVRKSVRDWDGAPPAMRTAELKIRSGAGFGLRRRAEPRTPGEAESGWDLVRTSFSDVGWYADYIASFGADVVVLEPVDLREAVIRKLKGVLA